MTGLLPIPGSVVLIKPGLGTRSPRFGCSLPMRRLSRSCPRLPGEWMKLTTKTLPGTQWASPAPRCQDGIGIPSPHNRTPVKKSSQPKKRRLDICDLMPRGRIAGDAALSSMTAHSPSWIEEDDCF